MRLLVLVGRHEEPEARRKPPAHMALDTWLYRLIHKDWLKRKQELIELVSKDLQEDPEARENEWLGKPYDKILHRQAEARLKIAARKILEITGNAPLDFKIRSEWGRTGASLEKLEEEINILLGIPDSERTPIHHIEDPGIAPRGERKASQQDLCFSIIKANPDIGKAVENAGPEGTVSVLIFAHDMMPGNCATAAVPWAEFEKAAMDYRGAVKNAEDQVKAFNSEEYWREKTNQERALAEIYEEFLTGEPPLGAIIAMVIKIDSLDQLKTKMVVDGFGDKVPILDIPRENIEILRPIIPRYLLAEVIDRMQNIISNLSRDEYENAELLPVPQGCPEGSLWTQATIKQILKDLEWLSETIKNSGKYALQELYPWFDEPEKHKEENQEALDRLRNIASSFCLVGNAAIKLRHMNREVQKSLRTLGEKKFGNEMDSDDLIRERIVSLIRVIAEFVELEKDQEKGVFTHKNIEIDSQIPNLLAGRTIQPVDTKKPRNGFALKGTSPKPNPINPPSPWRQRRGENDSKNNPR